MSYSLNVQAPTKAAAKTALAAEIARMTSQIAQAEALVGAQIDSLPEADDRDIAVNLGSQLQEATGAASINVSVNLTQRAR